MCGACGQVRAVDQWSTELDTRRGRWEAARVVNDFLVASRQPARVTATPGGWLVRSGTGRDTVADTLTQVWQALGPLRRPAPDDPAAVLRPGGAVAAAVRASYRHHHGPHRVPDVPREGTQAVSVTINSDMGESFGIHSFGNDDGLLPLVDTINVACGFHAGDPTGIRETVLKAAGAGVRVGAHPGLPDLVGFGRREMRLEPDEVRDLVLYQVGALVAFLDAEGLALDHIKPHGSLYGMLARDAALTDAVCDVAVQYAVPLYGLAGTAHQTVASARGVDFVAEFYVDLGYAANGQLLITRRPHPTSPDVAAARARLALSHSAVIAETGEQLSVEFDSICVHSDTPTAVQVAGAVRAVLVSDTTSQP